MLLAFILIFMHVQHFDIINFFELRLYSGRNPAREELVQLIKEHDKDGNGTIGRFT